MTTMLLLHLFRTVEWQMYFCNSVYGLTYIGKARQGRHYRGLKIISCLIEITSSMFMLDKCIWVPLHFKWRGVIAFKITFIDVQSSNKMLKIDMSNISGREAGIGKSHTFGPWQTVQYILCEQHMSIELGRTRAYLTYLYVHIVC